MSPSTAITFDTPEARQRLSDLLVDRATCGLSLSETLELDALAAELPDVDLDGIDRVAAELAIAVGDPTIVPELPSPLGERLRADAARCLQRPRPAAATPRSRRDAESQKHFAGQVPPGISPLRAAVPWLTAAAAIIIAAFTLLSGGDAAKPGDRAPWLRAESAADVRRLPIADNDLGIRGEVIWSTAEQRGFVRLTGLEPNDPKNLQYQLWIFDAARDARGETMNAVDGGVFDANETSELVIPITPAIRVFEPALFAITSEPPGGVVRHDPDLDPQRYRIVVTAAAATG